MDVWGLLLSQIDLSRSGASLLSVMPGPGPTLGSTSSVLEASPYGTKGTDPRCPSHMDQRPCGDKSNEEEHQGARSRP